MLIVIPELDEEQAGSTLSRFQTIIERTGGEVRDLNQWGRRKLAYEIGNRTEGVYAVMEFTAGDRTLTELKRILRVSDDVMRHMVVRLPESFVENRESASTAAGVGAASGGAEELPESPAGPVSQ